MYIDIDILYTTIQNSIKKFDWIIFTGDTNFRVNLPHSVTLDHVARYREAKKINSKEFMNHQLQ